MLIFTNLNTFMDYTDCIDLRGLATQKTTAGIIQCKMTVINE